MRRSNHLVVRSSKSCSLGAHRGEEMSGYELGSGRRSRVWRSEEDAVERLKELCNEEGVSPSELYDSKLISVAKVEKV